MASRVQRPTWGGRFTILERAGAGAMGEVWRARDELTGGLAALKLCATDEPTLRARFAREATGLARVRHPHVVGYVASGVEIDGAPWLAMEWLEGESLAVRLRRGPMPPPDVAALGAALADALAAIHAAGLVHRDVKPSNVVLRGGAGGPCLVDFGVVRALDGTASITRAGTAIGTPRYMAPEQVRGEPPADARADLWALGVVLWECLAGEPPFAGDDGLAVLAKVLLEPVPRLATRVPVPPALDEVIAGLLVKDPERRWGPASAVRGTLQALGAPHSRAPTGPIGAPEPARRLAALLLVVPAPGADRAAIDELARAASAAASRHAAVAERARVDGVVVTVPGGRGAQEQALVAARIGLVLREAHPGARLALALAREGEHGGLAGAIERAVQVVSRADAAEAVAIDEPMARLLVDRLDVRRGREGHVLARERPPADGARAAASPVVGRAGELSALGSALDAALRGAGAAAVVVLGEGGTGKSRLRAEAVAQLRARHPAAALWIARGDPSRARAPWALAGDLVRSACGLDAVAEGAVAATLAFRVGRAVGAHDAARVAGFLGEIAGAPADATVGDELRAARDDAALRGDQLRRALLDLADATARRGGLVIVVEDAQWGDAPSIAWVASALRVLSARPLAALAVGRPAAEARLAPLVGAGASTIVLGDLPDDAIGAIARASLGAAATDAAVAAVIARAGGNALFAEELAREVARGRNDALPATVLALIEERLDALAPDDARVLRAASVFGRVTWRAGIAALLPGTPALDAAIDRLADAGWLLRRGRSRFPGQLELVFRHAAQRDAAYAQTGDAQRAGWHAAAAAWLEARGEAEAAVVAAHLALGGRRDEARRWAARAAEQAVAAGEFTAALDHARAALEAGDEAIRASAALARAEAHRWRGEYQDALAASELALAASAPGTASWYTAAGERVVAASRLRRLDVLAETAAKLEASTTSGPPATPQVVAVARAAMLLLHANVPQRAGPLYAWLESVADGLAGEPVAAARALFAFAWRAHATGDWEAYRRFLGEAAAHGERAGDRRFVCQLRANGGHACVELGLWEEARALLEESLAIAERLGIASVAALCRNNLGVALARLGRLDEGIEVERAAVAAYSAAGDERLEGASRTYLAGLLLEAGRLDEALDEARRSTELAAGTPVLLPHASAALADVLRARGDVAAAAATARAAVEGLAKAARVEGDPTSIHLAAAEAWIASGDLLGAAEQAAAARKAVVAGAARIGDPAVRARWLDVPSHRRALALWGELADR